ESYHFGDAAEVRLHAPSHQIHERRAALLVRNVEHFSVGHAVEQRARKVLGGTAAAGSVVHGRVTHAHELDELLDVLRRQVVVDHEHVGDHRDRTDGRKILLEVI